MSGPNSYDALLIALGLVCRVCVALWGHSGYSSPPMHGDFEAQRHWLEITTSLPVGEWYKHTKLNDLQYWGLDYPPLTAYVSWMFGWAASHITPQLVELTSSRGYEQLDGRVFMRASVIICDTVLLIPVVKSICCEIVSCNRRSGFDVTISNWWLYTLSCILLPGLLLIDHGHFQYNGVCLALALYGGFLISRDRDILGSVYFCLSLNFKQMSLYYAPVFFCCLLRKCFVQPGIAAKIGKLLTLGVTVMAVFGILWAPFCVYHHPEDTCVSSLLQVLHRQFPFSRGIFEDKVANIWYAVSVAVDFRAFLSHSLLLRASLLLTLTLLAPTCYFLLTTPVTLVTFLLAMINSSLAFFLASFQVRGSRIISCSAERIVTPYIVCVLIGAREVSTVGACPSVVPSALGRSVLLLASSVGMLHDVPAAGEGQVACPVCGVCRRVSGDCNTTRSGGARYWQGGATCTEEAAERGGSLRQRTQLGRVSHEVRADKGSDRRCDQAGAGSDFLRR
jgi:alpha-1,3-glucosyltransferase